MNYSENLPVTTLRKVLWESGERNISHIAETLTMHRQNQIEKGLYTNTRFIDGGSDSTGFVRRDDHHVNSALVWCVNHYTGLNRDPRVIDAAERAVREFGTGCGTSGVSGGMCRLHKEAERRLAERVGKESAVLFPTGYTTNLGAISALVGPGDLVIFDRECHASIIDGVRLSGAKFVSFKHNNPEDLEKKLGRFSATHANVLVIVESAYSMSGDLCPIIDIANLKSEHDFLLYVDEAHSFGFYGDRGAGWVSENDVSDQVDFLMSTLSKATASIGGFVACDEKFRTVFETAANSYMFQACTPPSDVAAVLACLDILETDPAIARRIHELNAYMRSSLTSAGFNLGTSQSPVIPVFIPDEEELFEINAKLLQRGIFSVSVFHPAVKLGEGRLRFVVTHQHNERQIDYTVKCLDELVPACYREQQLELAAV